MEYGSRSDSKNNDNAKYIKTIRGTLSRNSSRETENLGETSGRETVGIEDMGG